ncbi:Suppressor of G2 allele of SKP1 [Echinococcus granulosus]|uniref:Suppressor of G2 allele of SKP1 n=2 Tax=Echinococcus granulosus TaxID=6210 RepID=W6USN7_ECHGR|nr:Suppressor of G2 allele of SKP1 [Echinococcus granulosus]EUB64308.1 Suppressor of G2 allele of SKP1 [Echinococcus granulosus]
MVRKRQLNSYIASSASNLGLMNYCPKQNTMAASDSEYQWYQSDSTVFVSVMRKGIDPATLRVTFVEDAVAIYINNELANQINLAHKIDPSKSLYKCTPMKIELKLAKTVSSNWSCLEGVDPASSLKVIDVSAPSKDGDKPKRVNKSYHDWDAVAKEADEIEEGDPLNNLFQKIFKDANDDTRRAMIKSFTESNGTVLSTNWDEVGKGKVEMKPPDGMEYKEYPK